MFEDIDPLTARPSELLASVVDLEPGLLMQSVLLMVDRSTLSARDAVTCLQVHERVTAWWASVQAEFIVAAATGDRVVDEFTLLDRQPDRDEERVIRIEDAVREEVASAVRWSPSTTQHRIDTARLLAGQLGATREALASGDITTGHVAALVDAVGRFDGRHADDGPEREAFVRSCDALQRRVLPVARRGTLSMTRSAARRAVLAIDADGERRRRLSARCTREVYVIDELDGISTVIARMSTETAHAVFNAVDTKAQENASESSARIGELRAEALASLVLDLQDTDGSRRSAHVDVVIGLDALLGLTEDAADLSGAGPVAADIVRDLLGDPSIAWTMRRLVTDPTTGHLLDVGRKSYEIPDRLRRYIATRDGTCRFPGCRRNATRCQIDHATAWDDNGPTDVANLGALCARHHQLKTHAGWAITQSRPDGSCTWQSPQGRKYPHEPGPLI